MPITPLNAHPRAHIRSVDHTKNRSVDFVSASVLSTPRSLKDLCPDQTLFAIKDKGSSLKLKRFGGKVKDLKGLGDDADRFRLAEEPITLDVRCHYVIG